MVEAHGSKATVHVALEDASGDSAIIEYVPASRWCITAVSSAQ
jgi:penicillin V acylase-like amidase (Ntn superfamily)